MPVPTPPLRIAIVEPDPLARERLRRRLASAAQHAVVATVASAAHARLDPAAVDVIVCAQTDVDAEPVASARGDALALAVRDGVVLLAPEDITHAVFDGVLVSVHRRGLPPVLTAATLKQLARRLPTSTFLRSHRRTLVNLDAIRLLRSQAHGGYLAELHGGGSVPVSRQVARRLRRALGLARAQPSAARERWHGDGGVGEAAAHHQRVG